MVLYANEGQPSCMWMTGHGDIMQILASYMITFIQTTPPPKKKVVFIICLDFKYLI